MYSSQYGCNFTSVIPTNIYGKNDIFDPRDSHVIPGLIHKCYLAQKSGEPFTIMGSGKPMRQFVYSKDLAKLMLWTLLSYNEPEPIIFSVDEEAEISIGDVATMIADAMEFKASARFA